MQEQLEAGIRELIKQGTIKAGVRLPATRALSQQLGVSRNTVKNAYLNLMSQGYLYSSSTSGTFVSQKLPDLAISALAEDELSLPKADLTIDRPAAVLASPAQQKYDFRLASIDPTIAPERTWRRLLLRHLPYRSRHAGHVDSAGLAILREAIGSRISPLRGMSVSPDNTFIVCNDYRGIDTVGHALLRPGARVAVEDPCDTGLAYLLERAGVELLPIPLDDQGLLVEALPSQGVALVCVSPSHQQPMGMTMSLERRRQLLDWASESGAYILEQDTYGEFCYDDSPLPSLFSIDSDDRVIYVNSFSAWIGTGARVGYLAAPPLVSAQIAKAMPYLNPGTSWLDQRVTAEFISSESLFGHLRRVRQTFKDRRDALAAAIKANTGQPTVLGKKAGRHLAWHLPQNLPSVMELKRRASAAGIALATLYDFYRKIGPANSGCDPDRTVFLGYTAMPDEKLQEGVARLVEAWRR